MPKRMVLIYHRSNGGDHNYSEQELSSSWDGRPWPQ